MSSKECKFTQGYVAAICTFIRMAGMADSEVVEAFRSGVGKVSMSELKKRGVDVHDLEILKKHWKELSR